VCLSVCLFVCTITDFSAAEKDSGVKLCTIVRLLSGMSFPHFGELRLAESHGGGITSGMYASTHCCHAAAPGEARWGSRNWVASLSGAVGIKLGAAASRKAVWWDLRLASLLTHLFVSFKHFDNTQQYTGVSTEFWYTV